MTGRVGLSTLARLLIGLEVAAAVALTLRLLPLEAWLRQESAARGNLGPLAPALYACLYAVGVVVFAPGSVLTLGSGLLFGPLRGFGAASVGSVAGASAAFLIARHLARSRVEAWAGGNPRFAALDRAIEEKGWRIVALTRLSPVFPFGALNYAYGVTRVRFAEYVLASWVAMAPGTLLYVYLGSLGRAGAQALAGSDVETAKIGLNVLGAAATGAVTYLVTRMAQQILSAPSRAAALEPRAPAGKAA